MSAERDLLSNLFSDEQPYPWEPLNPAGPAFLDRLAAEFDDPAVDAALAEGWNSFSAQMESQWASVQATSASPVQAETLLSALKAQFQGRMPETALGAVATSATRLMQSGRPIAEQLVDIVQGILPGWDRGDLAVLARPLAYSLRDGRGEILDLTLQSTPQVDWDALSEVEKARLSLAIASVALNLAQQES